MRGTLLAGLTTVRRSGVAAAGLVAVIGLGAAGTASALVHRAELRAADTVMERYTRSVQAAVQSEVQRYVDAVNLLAAGLRAQDVITSAGFAATTATLPGLRLRGISGVTFLVAGTAGDTAELQARWRERGADGLTLDPAGPGAGPGGEHIYAVLRHTLDGAGPASGTDVTLAAEPTEALLRARNTGTTTVSDPYVLLRDRDRPSSERQRSIVITTPVQSADTQFVGWLSIGVRAADLIGGVLPQHQGRVDIAIRHDSDPVPVARLGTRGADGNPAPTTPPVAERELSRRVPLTVADQRWTVWVTADRSALPGADSYLDRGIAGSGVALSALLAALVYVLATARRRLEVEVDRATAAARGAEVEAVRQAGLLTAVMNSISDGVVVIDGQGRFLLHNAAAREMVATPRAAGDPVDGPGGCGMFRPDGETPWPEAEAPLLRALRGEEVRNVEMVVRTAGRPDGVHIDVSARPLDPEAGQPGAVAVVHDITERRAADRAIRALNAQLEERVVARTAELAGQAEALRAANAELEAFSYSVSHDLRAPLRAVDGFARMLELDHADNLDADGRRYLNRVRSGAQQMGQLIDGLLAFSRMQRQAMTRTDVRVGDLVADVWEELAADREGRTVELTVDELPPAVGDPRLLRQVVANLLGNALKYTRERDVARIHVGVDETGAYLVRDNGAGFDPRYTDKLFQVFQRLHRAEEYEGTGVGLALASRIIQRHGGRIWATARPGQGASFHFTLPHVEEATDALHAEPGPSGRGQSERSGAGAARV